MSATRKDAKKKYVTSTSNQEQTAPLLGERKDTKFDYQGWQTHVHRITNSQKEYKKDKSSTHLQNWINECDKARAYIGVIEAEREQNNTKIKMWKNILVRHQLEIQDLLAAHITTAEVNYKKKPNQDTLRLWNEAYEAAQNNLEKIEFQDTTKLSEKSRLIENSPQKLKKAEQELLKAESRVEPSQPKSAPTTPTKENVRAYLTASVQANPTASAQANPTASAQANPTASAQANPTASAQANPTASAQANPTASAPTDSIASAQAKSTVDTTAFDAFISSTATPSATELEIDVLPPINASELNRLLAISQARIAAAILGDTFTQPETAKPASASNTRDKSTISVDPKLEAAKQSCRDLVDELAESPHIKQLSEQLATESDAAMEAYKVLMSHSDTFATPHTPTQTTAATSEKKQPQRFAFPCCCFWKKEPATLDATLLEKTKTKSPSIQSM